LELVSYRNPERSAMSTTNFRVKTQRAAYCEGYQDALQHIAAALAEGGVERAELWIADNTVTASA